MADLTTVADVQAWLGLAPGTDDALLSTLVTAASGFMEKWCGRRFTETTHTDILDGAACGRQRVAFRHYPVSAVTSLTIEGRPVPPGDAVSTPGYYFTPTMLMLNGWRFGQGFGTVALTYTAGYAVIPADLARACVELTAFEYRENGRIGLSSSAIGGETTSFITRDMPARVASLLARYQRVTP